MMTFFTSLRAEKKPTLIGALVFLVGRVMHLSMYSPTPPPLQWWGGVKGGEWIQFIINALPPPTHTDQVL